MNIAILGAGAMGSLFGGYLSKENNVYLVEVNQNRAESIQKNGVRIREQDGSEQLFRPYAVSDTTNLPEMDLVIVFVKAMYTVSALEANKHLIGENTYLMTLQNGAGHDEKLLKYADADHVIVGSTQHNSSIISDGFVNHGGGGRTTIGLLSKNSSRIQHISATFAACGFDCTTSDEAQKQIWNKLFLNTSASALTAVLQVPLGFIEEDPNAAKLMKALVDEAVAVANAQGFTLFDESEVLENIKTVLRNARGGYTSIYADVKNGNRTEVDTISGSVVSAAQEFGISVPYHEVIVALIHAMENKMQNHIN